MVTYITDVLICKFFYGKNYHTVKEFPLFTLTRLKYVTVHSLIVFFLYSGTHTAVSAKTRTTFSVCMNTAENLPT